MRAIQMRDYNCHLLDTSNNNDNFVLKFIFFSIKMIYLHSFNGINDKKWHNSHCGLFTNLGFLYKASYNVQFKFQVITLNYNLESQKRQIHSDWIEQKKPHKMIFCSTNRYKYLFLLRLNWSSTLILATFSDLQCIMNVFDIVPLGSIAA